MLGMKICIRLLVFLNLFAWLPLQAQDVLGKEQISYQAIALDSDGRVMANQDIEVRASFTSKDGKSNIWFSELHSVRTDESGRFQLSIGGSPVQEGKMADVPWGEVPIFLSLDMKQADGSFQLLNRSQMLSVPYAFHAGKTARVLDEKQMELRNQSIYWTTTGNNESRPNYHFLGNRDSEDLYIKTNNTTRAIFTKEGQLEIYPGTAIKGNDTDEGAYPVTINGSNQGIYIEIDEERSGANNFLTFEDDDGIQGRVEGQTLDELTATEGFRIQVANFALDAAKLTASSIATAVEVGGELASILGAPAGAALAIDVGSKIAEGIAILIQAGNWTANLFLNIGVSYSSGGADFAEYIPRVPGERDLFPGQVVGIKNGLVSLQTQGADHLRVISTAPLALGNMPQAEEAHLYEMVAFRGQVPVFVSGPVNIGDYILPSGKNDGLALAVCPEEMQAKDFRNIIGVAWSPADDAPMNLVNVAIGINSNDLGYKLDELDQKVNNILEYLQGNGTLDGLDVVDGQGREAVASESGSGVEEAFEKGLSDEEFDQFLDENEAFFNDVYGSAKKALTEQGYDLTKYPEILDMLDNPVPFIKKIRRDPRFLSQWASVDTIIQMGLEKD